MKNSILNATVALITLTIGLFVVWQVRNAFTFDSNDYKVVGSFQAFSVKKNINTSADGKVEIRFIEFSETKDGMAMKFEITNQNTKPAYYSGYSSNESGYIEPGIPLIKINGIEEERFICGTGLVTSHLPSGNSMEVTIYSNYFRKEDLNKGKEFQFGFHFSIGNKSNYKKHWSEVLPISTSIKKRLYMESLAREKNF